MTAAFLAQAGFGAARLDPLPSDASARRYTRLLGGPRPALLMEAPPPENTRPFIAIAGHIRGLGLSAPEIIAADPDQGLVLLEDFGDATHAALLDGGADAPALYAEAAEALAALHEAPPPPGLPAWDAAAMARATAATFLDWWWPAAMGAAPSDDLRAGLAAALHAMLAPFAGTQGFVHRDYFPANLMRLEARAGARRSNAPAPHPVLPAPHRAAHLQSTKQDHRQGAQAQHPGNRANLCAAPPRADQGASDWPGSNRDAQSRACRQRG